MNDLFKHFQHGGANILEASDKNDQTVLHTAAYFGNVSVSYIHVLNLTV